MLSGAGAPWAVACADQDDPITTASLLAEMIDREALARFPDPAYTCRQFSSYDRAATSPDDNWFANGDASQYLRTEEHDGRTEWVMMDADGPGAVVRIWSANPPGDGTMRVYLDGSDEPVIAASMADVLGGRWRVSSPLSAVRSRGWNLYFPIPYARHCKITCDKAGFYYQINYRTYKAGTEVQSFQEEHLDDAKTLIDRVQTSLLNPPAPRGDTISRIQDRIAPGESARADLPPGTRSIRSIALRIAGVDPATALRSTVLKIECDGETTVWCPVGDFFGTGIGLNEFAGWWRSVEPGQASIAGTEGALTCRWVMPYRRSCRVSVLNLSDQSVSVNARVGVGDWKWDDRSMHFYSVWRQENPIHTRPMKDWNYVEVRGKGVFVGDVLAVVNPVKNWWGEGDEKIYVDGEGFPSHFGTGTEDYYGYAWCCPVPFQAPFHAQPRCDGPDNYGHTTVTRVRSLDAIPFTESFRFDMEVWHWKECDVGYSATSYFYAIPGAAHNRPPQPDEAARGPLDPAPLPPPYRIDGAIEAETMRIVDQTDGITAGPQGGFGPRMWSGEQQLWVQAVRVGDFIELEIPVDDERPRHVVVFATKSWDYAIVRFFLNGERVGADQDLFNTEDRAVVATGPIDLGTATPRDGRLRLRVEVVGSNERSEGSGTFFGIDCVVLTID